MSNKPGVKKEFVFDKTQFVPQKHVVVEGVMVAGFSNNEKINAILIDVLPFQLKYLYWYDSREESRIGTISIEDYLSGDVKVEVIN